MGVEEEMKVDLFFSIYTCTTLSWRIECNKTRENATLVVSHAHTLCVLLPSLKLSYSFQIYTCTAGSTDFCHGIYNTIKHEKIQHSSFLYVILP